MRAKGRVDSNQPSIVKSLRKLGFSVWITSGHGHGAPDLVIARGGATWLVELKVGDSKLTSDEFDFHYKWNGKIIIARSLDDILKECAFNRRIEKSCLS